MTSWVMKIDNADMFRGSTWITSHPIMNQQSQVCLVELSVWFINRQAQKTQVSCLVQILLNAPLFEESEQCPDPRTSACTDTDPGWSPNLFEGACNLHGTTRFTRLSNHGVIMVKCLTEEHISHSGAWTCNLWITSQCLYPMCHTCPKLQRA